MHAEGTPRPRNLGTDVAVRSKAPASGKKPTTRPTSRKTPNKRKVSNKTTKAKASKSKKIPSGSSVGTSRARRAAPLPPEASAQPVTPPKDLPEGSIPRSLGFWKPAPGRPKGTPDVWTDAHKAEVAGWIYDYTDSTDLPSEAEFCFRYGVRQQRLGEFAELVAAKDYLQAKRALAIQSLALRLDKETGARASYLNRMSANVGAFSMTDKSEFQIDDRRPINLTINPELLKNDPNAEVSHGD